MTNNKFFEISLSVLPGVIVFVELFMILPIKKHAQYILKNTQKSMEVIKSAHISDHWKEKALRRYSFQLMVSSLAIALFLVILFLAFGGIYGIFGLITIGDLDEVIRTFSQVELHIITICIGIFYAVLRSRFTGSKAKTDTDYTLFSKILHHIALGNSMVKEIAFDIDCITVKMQSPLPKVSSPVYITGLARAGTTILLESLYSTGAFTSLTYRDMPLVTAPYLWNKITKGSAITADMKKERAHGDSLYVNYDSPEAFEEVFWMTFLNTAYVKEDHLEVHGVNDDITRKYKSYVRNIIKRSKNSGPVRYLSKNNNNLMRIDAIKSAFPDAIFIIPFRNPISHAKSLHIQHERFIKMHAEDKFSRQYMHWLGHFEFGSSLKPFGIHKDVFPVDEEEPAKLGYWLRYWKCVYEYILDRHTSDAVFFSYDKFCEQPEQCLSNLESALLLEEGSLKSFSNNIRPAKKYLSEARRQPLPREVKDVYNKLIEISI